MKLWEVRCRIMMAEVRAENEEEARKKSGFKEIEACECLVMCRGCRRFLSEIPAIEKSLGHKVAFSYC